MTRSPAETADTIRRRRRYRLTPQPSHADIARRAYELYLRRGAEHGLALQDWLEAERDLSKPQKRSARTRAIARRKPS